MHTLTVLERGVEIPGLADFAERQPKFDHERRAAGGVTLLRIPRV